MERSVRLICTLVLFGIALHTPVLEAAKLRHGHQHEDRLPIGSPSWCMDKMRSFNLTHFEVLPGNGWDNLENKERGQVIQHTYTECRTTDDGKFLIPDGVVTTPVKSSKLDVFSEVYSSWMDYKETTSKSINVAAKYSRGFFSIDGTFSAESQSVKENQADQKSSIARTQARYVKYIAKLQPDMSFHPTFRARVMEIAKLIQTNEKVVARYESQQLVRDFGTHVLTGMDAGAVITQVQHVSLGFVSTHSEKETSLAASLSTSFSLGLYGKGGLNVSGGSTTQVEASKDFSNSVTQSTIKTYGGPTYQPQNFQLDDWARGMLTNPILIGMQMFKMGHAHLLRLTLRLVGCIKLVHKMPFLESDHCSGYIQRNPLTGESSCPSGYNPVLLDSSNIGKTETTRECHRVWYKVWLGKKCTNIPVPGSVTVSSYWCVATGDVHQSSGYMFGGLFTPHIGNLMTGGSSCPPNFNKLPLLDGLTVCVTQDFDSGFPFSAPFGGFFTCKNGNPLAASAKTDQSHWPHSCPTGFSSHLALMSNECEIEYCAQLKHISDKGLPSVRKPPFMAYPNYRHVEATEIFIDPTSNTWTKLPTDMLEIQDATLDLEKAKLVFRNSPDFEEQMQLINIPTMPMAYGNASSKNDNSSIPISRVSVKDKETRRIDTDYKLGLNDELKLSPDSKDHQALPNGMVVALSVVSTLLFVCVIVILTMYKRRRVVYRGGEEQTLLG
ncbi:macrophage-expressed gene 1 protein-like [Pecten maximus]|uniref:macrophage-expressed gene 1 protein-like n=1 Tax=Pecten maximus TaxID=6579 RepID=UPI0014582EC2|nr:macrophage-expressed gene 1 protein-like [Pecten maximus]